MRAACDRHFDSTRVPERGCRRLLRRASGSCESGCKGQVVCVFEHHGGFEKWVRPELAIPAERLYVLNYHVLDAAKMREHIARLTKERVGYHHCTDDHLPNPWDTLPAYWDDLVAAVKAARLR